MKLSPPLPVELRLRNGTRVGGHLVRATPDAYHVRTDSGVRAITAASFLAIERRATARRIGTTVTRGFRNAVARALARVRFWAWRDRH